MSGGTIIQPVLLRLVRHCSCAFAVNPLGCRAPHKVLHSLLPRQAASLAQQGVLLPSGEQCYDSTLRNHEWISPLSDITALPLIEVCVEGIDGLVAAQKAGADRVELCASLIEGGITPSFGTVRIALELAKIPLHVIVRPRGGDFLYSPAEHRSMVADVLALRDLGVAGVVVGCLKSNGTIDEERMSDLVAAAGPLNVTCHRAFDMTRDPAEALEALIRCKVGRVLTSGQRDTAAEGSELLAELGRQAAGRIIILGCGALDPDNIGAVRRKTRLTEMHFASLKDVPSAMTYRNPRVGMGGTDLDREYRNTMTDEAVVAATIAAARA